MPRASATALSPPSPGDPDRKRVLNVLAQRRYRQRRREKLAVLEHKSRSNTSATEDSSTSPESTSDRSVIESMDPAMNLGVPLPEGYSDFFTSEQDLLNTNDIDFDFSLLDTEDISAPFTFNNALVPQPVQTTTPLNPDPEVPVLKILKIAATIAQTLGCSQIFWDPSSKWTISQPSLPGLPANMQPTVAQRTIPHHPFFDVLPWPQLRTKLICVFALPEEQRPQNARDPMAHIQVAYDIEDEKDGFRVNGEGMERDDWEIGEAFFKNWWWALDRDIVETSNAWRRRRGQARLSITAT